MNPRGNQPGKKSGSTSGSAKSSSRAAVARAGSPKATATKGRGSTATKGRGSTATTRRGSPAKQAPRSRRAPLVLGVLCLLIALVGLTRIAVVLVGPPPRIADRQHQLAFLESSIAGGSDDRMQSLFPEGFYFMHVLTGTAAARLTPNPNELDDARDHLGAIESPAGVRTFGNAMVPEHGIFATGWSLNLAVDIAITSRSDADMDAVRSRVGPVAAALVGTRGASPFLASYPNQFWPCDSVVAASALSRAGDLLGRTDLVEVGEAWSRRAMAYADPATGLLPHRVDDSGVALDGPRGSSQAIIQYFWPELDRDPALWQKFCDALVDRRAGLVGVREFPRGNDSPGDVDSGPLVAGISLSASAVTLGAARRWGDAHLAQTLAQQGELLGAPIQLPGRRAYALGVMPAGDAFLLWSQSAPMAGDGPNAKAPAPQWWLLLLMAAAPGVLGLALLGWAVHLRSRLRAAGRGASRGSGRGASRVPGKPRAGATGRSRSRGGSPRRKGAH